MSDTIRVTSFYIKVAEHTKAFSSFGSSAIFYKTRRFLSLSHERFGFVGNFPFS